MHVEHRWNESSTGTADDVVESSMVLERCLYATMLVTAHTSVHHDPGQRSHDQSKWRNAVLTKNANCNPNFSIWLKTKHSPKGGHAWALRCRRADEADDSPCTIAFSSPLMTFDFWPWPVMMRPWPVNSSPNDLYCVEWDVKPYSTPTWPVKND